jgi:drug/metabolite transporter (DMT)-like permease
VSAILLLVTSSLAWAGFDAARKALGKHLTPVPMLVGLCLGHALPLAAWLAWRGVPPVAAGYVLPALASIALNVAGNWLFLAAVARSPLSLTVPLLALTPVGAACVAGVMLGEWPGPRQAAGIAAIVAGALALQLPPGGSPKTLLSALRAEPGVPLMGLVAACWALVGPFDKLATQASSAAFHGCVLYAGVGLVLLPWLARDAAGRRLLTAPPAWLPLALASAVGLLALVTQLLVMQQLMVSLVEAVKRMVGLVMAVAVGALAFGEPVHRRQLGAIAGMGVGLWLLLVR